MSEIEKKDVWNITEKAGELIDIKFQGVSSALSSYRNEARKLETLISNMKQTARAAQNSWQGRASEAQMGQVEQIINWIDAFESQYRGFIKYLNDKTDNYIEEDIDISRLIDKNQDAFGRGN